jgi:K+-sensing histidine kinase KdpD
MLTSSVTHEMVTPLKCMISFAAIVLKELQNSPKRKEAELIMTTAKLLLS